MGAALFAFVCVLSVVIYFILSANQQRAKQKYQDQLDQPDPFDDAYQRALGHVRQGNPSEALTEIKECVRLQPCSAKAFNLMGDCYNSLNQLDDADYAYGESIKRIMLIRSLVWLRFGSKKVNFNQQLIYVKRLSGIQIVRKPKNELKHILR